jgi:transposase-like protein
VTRRPSKTDGSRVLTAARGRDIISVARPRQRGAGQRKETCVVSVLEVYTLTCNACGKSKAVTRLHVHGNLAEIERTWVCPDCQRQGRVAGEGRASGEKPATSEE